MAKKKTKTKSTTAKKPPTKTEIIRQISDRTDLPRRDINAVFDELQDLAGKSLKKHGVFNLPGLCKMQVKKKKGTPAGNRRNPFTGEVKWQPAKPASKQVKIRPLKALKDQVG